MADLSLVKTIAVVVIAVSVMAGMGVVVLDTMRISTAVLQYQATDVANYSVANASTITLTHAFIDASTFRIYNGTGGDEVSVNVANYTLTCAPDKNVDVNGVACTVQIGLNETGDVDLGAWVLPVNANVEYTYDVPLTAGHGYVSAGEGIDALDTVGSFLPIVALVVIAGLIIVIVSGSFSKDGL